MRTSFLILAALVLVAFHAGCDSQPPPKIPGYASPAVSEGWTLAYRGRFSNGFQPVDYELYTNENAQFSIPSRLRDALTANGWANAFPFDSPDFVSAKRNNACLSIDDFNQSPVWVDLITRENPETRALQSGQGSVMRVMIYRCTS